MTKMIKVIAILSIVLSIAIGVRITADDDSCAPNSLTFTADLSATSEWDHYWERCVGSGHALLGLRHGERRLRQILLKFHFRLERTLKTC